MMSQQMPPAQITVVKAAPIEALTLPPGWFEDVPEKGPIQSGFKRNFRLDSSPQAEIFLLDRGQPVDSNSIEFFMRLLSERPQILTKSKIESLTWVLGNLGRPTVFRPLLLRTETISGANVLSVEGRWSNDIDVYALLMQQKPGGDRIINLHYEAPKEEFRKNLAAVKAAFAQIVWQH